MVTGKIEILIILVAMLVKIMSAVFYASAIVNNMGIADALVHPVSAD